MPSGLCKCGLVTNSAVSNWWDSYDEMDNWKPKKIGEATYCYVRWRDGNPEPGCVYDRASRANKDFADCVIRNCYESLGG
jgi:hypothetical protein